MNEIQRFFNNFLFLKKIKWKINPIPIGLFLSNIDGLVIFCWVIHLILLDPSVDIEECEKLDLELSWIWCKGGF